MQEEYNTGFFKFLHPAFCGIITDAHIPGDVMQIQHLAASTGGSTNEVSKHHLIHTGNIGGHIPVDIGLNIAAVKDIPVFIFAAPVAGKCAVPNPLIDLVRRGGGKQSLAFLQFVKFQRKGRNIHRSAKLRLRQRGHMKNCGSSGQGFLRKLHQAIRLGTGQPVGAGGSAVIHGNLDIRKQLRCILNLIDENRRGMQLQKHSGIGFGKPALLQIVQRNLGSCRPLHQMPQHSGFSDLTRTGQQHTRVLFIDCNKLLFKLSLNIHCSTSSMLKYDAPLL